MGGYSATSDLDLGKKLEIWSFGMGRGRGAVFCNFGFGLREKVGNLEFWDGGYSATLDLDLGKKVGNLDFRDFGMGEKREIWIFGIFCNFGFGLREKSWKFGFLGWGEGGYSATLDLDLGKKVGNLDFRDGGVFCNYGFGLREKSWKFGFLGWGGILQLRIWT